MGSGNAEDDDADASGSRSRPSETRCPAVVLGLCSNRCRSNHDPDGSARGRRVARRHAGAGKMAGMATASPVTTGVASEREVLGSFLDFHRGVMVRKVADLTESAATARFVPSDTTLAGLLNHLAVTERQWFQQVLSGQGPPQEGDEGPDTSWMVSGDVSVAALVAVYEQECERSRSAAAAYELDYAVAHPVLGQVSLRWIFVHMIEETARHAGHADILRELTDGATGVM